jgi:hypothetical protein
VSHPVFGVIRRLVDKGRTWVKLSVTYDNTKDGPPEFPSSGFFAGGSWAAKRLPPATHSTAAGSTERVHLISGFSCSGVLIDLQRSLYFSVTR